MIMNNRKIIGADFFCGAGGFTSGFLKFLNNAKIDYEWYALNHDEDAIAAHKANHPKAKHWPFDIYAADPLELLPGGYLDVLIGSPECTDHSNAKGGGPCNEQSRCQANKIVDWAKQIDIRAIVVENVREFMKWGPLLKKDTVINGKLYKKNHRDPRKAGTYFRRWISNLKKLGYTVEYNILNSANYGAHTARQRFFMIATKGRQKIEWPVATHAQDPQDFFVKPWKPARDIIDWSIPGQSIFMRQAGMYKYKNGNPMPPLCQNTVRRICYGLEKFSGLKLDPYLVMLYGQSNARSLDLPLPTITNGNHLALCTPFIYPANYSGSGAARVYSLDNPLPTLTTKSSYYLCEPFFTDYHGTGLARDIKRPFPTINTSGNHLGLAEPYVVQYHGGKSQHKRCYSLNNPLPVIDTSNRYYLCEPFIAKNYSNGDNVSNIKRPLPTVTTKDRFSLIQPISDCYQVDVLYRMLKSHELAAAMGFKENYIFASNDTATKKQIGNAVEVNQAYALAAAVIPQLLQLAA